MDKNKENHIFTTNDLFITVGLFALVFGIVTSIVTNAMVDQKPQQARQRAKQLAQQILLGGYSRSLAVSSDTEALPTRSIASIGLDIRASGRIGMDPWSNAYYYRIFDSKDLKSIQVVVLSTGPDKIINTDQALFDSRVPYDPKTLSVLGDDIAEMQN